MSSIFFRIVILTLVFLISSTNCNLFINRENLQPFLSEYKFKTKFHNNPRLCSISDGPFCIGAENITAAQINYKKL